MDGKKGRKRKGKSSFDINQLTKGQKKHLKEYGELHPVDLEGDDHETQATTMKKTKRIERIVDDSMKMSKGKKQSNIIHKEPYTQDVKQEDEFEEVSAYQKLVSSFVNGQALSKKNMTRKLTKKLHKNNTDNVLEKSTEGSMTEKNLEIKENEDKEILENESENEENDSDSEDESKPLPGNSSSGCG